MTAQAVDATNLALSGTATQSSTYPVGGDRGAELAIDGNTDGNRAARSTTHTQNEPNPWWQVELEATQPIGDVTIWNRTDGSTGRLSNFWVFASAEPFTSDDLSALIDDPNVSAQRVTTKPSPSTTLDFNGTDARYVRVQLQGTNFLSLAEVEITSGQAPSGYPRVTQSSTYARGFSRVASLAIDGNTDGTDAARSTSHTKKQQDPWWQVELEAPIDLGSVTVWNRTDKCCTGRLSNFWIFASDQPFASNDLDALIADPNVVGHHLTAKPSPKLSVNFGGVAARFVRIQLEGTNHLSLAEVEIAPHQAPDTYPFATQSTTSYGGVASRALDGNVDGAYQQGSVTATHPADAQPWFNIELAGNDELRAIDVWHRTEASIERNNNYTVKVSTTSANACTQGADYSADIVRDGLRANRVAMKKTLKVPTQTLRVKSVCITKTNTGPLSLAEVGFYFGTNDTEGDDNYVEGPDQMFSGWSGPRRARGGDDNFDLSASRYGDATFQDALAKGFIKSVTNQGNQIYQRHAYGFAGDDVITMRYPEFLDDDVVRMGHHAYGGDGTDTFNFVDTANVPNGMWVFGRIDDFAVDEDVLQVEGQTVDFNNLPSGVRIVTYAQPGAESFEREQQWLLIENAQGGHIFYALEGARYITGQPYWNDPEKHFTRVVPDESTFTDVTFEDTVPYVPVNERRGLSPSVLRKRNPIEPRIENYVGTDGGELINGNPGIGTGYKQNVFGRDGQDLIGTGPSEDLVFGERGDDRIWGGTEDDQLDGGNGNDNIFGGQANDEIIGGKGDDVLTGDSGVPSRFVWQFDAALAVPIGDEVLSDGSSLRAATPDLVTIEDDDATLDGSDSSEQVLLHRGAQSNYDSTVGLKGIVRVQNDTTKAIANAYQLEIDRVVYPPPPNNPLEVEKKVTVWVFDKPDFVRRHETIVPIGMFRSLNQADFGSIARSLAKGTNPRGADVFVFDTEAGNDTITDFEVGKDKLRVPATAQGALSVTNASGVALASFADTSITLANVPFGEFSQSDIVFE